MGINIWKRKQREPQESAPSVSLHRDCNTLPLSVFITCLCDHDLRGLVIQGHASQDELNEAWAAILSEYSSLIKSPEAAKCYELLRMVHNYQVRIIAAQKAAILLEYNRDDRDVLRMIKELGIPGPRSISGYIKMWNVELQARQKELDALNAKAAGRKRTRESFTSELVVLSRFQQYRVTLDTTVAEYCTILNHYESYQKEWQKKTS